MHRALFKMVNIWLRRERTGGTGLFRNAGAAPWRDKTRSKMTTAAVGLQSRYVERHQNVRTQGATLGNLAIASRSSNAIVFLT